MSANYTVGKTEKMSKSHFFIFRFAWNWAQKYGFHISHDPELMKFIVLEFILRIYSQNLWTHKILFFYYISNI